MNVLWVGSTVAKSNWKRIYGIVIEACYSEIWRYIAKETATWVENGSLMEAGIKDKDG